MKIFRINAFTLTEILAVMTILVIIGGAFATSLIQTRESYKIADEAIQQVSDARNAVGRMANILSQSDIKMVTIKNCDELDSPPCSGHLIRFKIPTKVGESYINEYDNIKFGALNDIGCYYEYYVASGGATDGQLIERVLCYEDFCGDGKVDVDLGEDCSWCEEDYIATGTDCCGDGVCESTRGESVCNCAECGAIVCGDGVCCGEAGETACSCSADCGTCGAGNCFLAGTKITMAGGSTKPIENIAVGDIVLAFDASSQKFQPDRVTGTLSHNNTHKYWIINDSIKVSPNHPVLSRGRYVRLDTLRIGDFLTDEQGRDFRINSIDEIHETVTSYNFVVNPLHTYIADGIIVHNEGPENNEK